jgi:NAD(P)H-flavin reductase
MPNDDLVFQHVRFPRLNGEFPTVYRVVHREELAPCLFLFEIEAPLVAAKAQGGQFVIVRVDEEGERIPLTVADYHRKRGTVTIIFAVVGTSTTKLAQIPEGGTILNFTGPLGRPSHVEKFGTVVMVGGGLCIAPVYPIARAMKRRGNRVVSIIGARSKELLFYLDKMKRVSHQLHITTDDGSLGHHGFVTQVLERELKDGLKPDLVLGIGPVVMMRALAKLTGEWNLKTMVSLNPIMVDGTGMCGSCRVTVGGETRFVCVDGPDFDAHTVDFDELIKRQRFYLEEEKVSMNRHERISCAGGCGDG